MYMYSKLARESIVPGCQAVAVAVLLLWWEAFVGSKIVSLYSEDRLVKEVLKAVGGLEIVKEAIEVVLWVRYTLQPSLNWNTGKKFYTGDHNVFKNFSKSI